MARADREELDAVGEVIYHNWPGASGSERAKMKLRNKIFLFVGFWKRMNLRRQSAAPETTEPGTLRIHGEQKGSWMDVRLDSPDSVKRFASYVMSTFLETSGDWVWALSQRATVCRALEANELGLRGPPEAASDEHFGRHGPAEAAPDEFILHDL